MDAKAGARERLDAAQQTLIGLSHRIHANPELGYEEEKASRCLGEALDSAGFAALPNLSTPAFDLATTNGASANLKPSEELALVDSNNNVIGAPSAPDPDTDGFNACTWATSCAAPGSS